MDAIRAAATPHGRHPAGSPQTMQSGPRAGTSFVYVRDGDGTMQELIQPAAAGGAESAG